MVISNKTMFVLTIRFPNSCYWFSDCRTILYTARFSIGASIGVSVFR
ncbi:hypothetical protein DYY66_1897 [Candidatus Nitrosotalea sp. FS]|nr:hypothetical protein [Candidatus Nitrosotalea sp. FS]